MLHYENEFQIKFGVKNQSKNKKFMFEIELEKCFRSNCQILPDSAVFWILQNLKSAEFARANWSRLGEA